MHFSYHHCSFYGLRYKPHSKGNRDNHLVSFIVGNFILLTLQKGAEWFTHINIPKINRAFRKKKNVLKKAGSTPWDILHSPKIYNTQYAVLNWISKLYSYNVQNGHLWASCEKFKTQHLFIVLHHQAEILNLFTRLP